jgi:anti-sigma factor ChrR (cupin superfamily)
LERLAAFIDGTLERVEHRRVSEHVRTCEPCLRLLREARALLAAEEPGGQV